MKRSILISLGLLVVGLLIAGGFVVKPLSSAFKQAFLSYDKQQAQKARTLQGAREIISDMRNPNSLVWEEVKVLPNGTTCYRYRAENGFGGINKGSAVLPEPAPPGSAEVLVAAHSLHLDDESFRLGGSSSWWDDICADHPGEDVTEVVRAKTAKR